VGIALRRRAVASYMRRLQYLRRCQQLSIENDAALHVVGPHDVQITALQPSVGAPEVFASVHDEVHGV
jgi:hypothetical protein